MILTIPLLVIVIFLNFHGLSEQKNTYELILLAAQNSAIKTKFMVQRNDKEFSNSFDKNVNNLKIVDLKQNLNSEFEDIQCKQSMGYKELRPVFCVNNEETDLISRELWNNKVYEEHILSNLTQMI